MTRRPRCMVFGIGAAGIAALLAISVSSLPGAGDVVDRYANAINQRTFAERNITDAVTAVNFDYRGFDTVGEEFILFVSVMGSLVLLREHKEKSGKLRTDAENPKRDIPPSDAIRLWTVAMVAPKVLFGLYVISHGQLSPGGGFQGGVILASAVLIIYLGENFQVFHDLVPRAWVEAVEGSSAALFVLIGLAAMLARREFLANFLPLGKAHELTSGGTIGLISLVTGFEVAAGFTILLLAFLEATLREGKSES